MKAIHLRTTNFISTILLACTVAASASAQTLTVLNAASFAGGSVAPGSIVTIFGSNLATGTASVSDASHPAATLAGTQVTFGGIPASLFYVSPTQINAVVGATTPLGTAAVKVVSDTGTTTGSIVIDANAAPGLFSLSGTGTHDGAIVDALTGRIGAAKATTPTSTTFLSLYLTGANFTTPPVVMIGGVTVPVTFAGASPCCAGLQQINISIPTSLAGAGRVPVTVKTGTTLSNVVEIVVLPARGNGEFRDEIDDQDRSRELSAVAAIPGTSLALVADENDDVLRQVDVVQKKVVRVIALAADAEPTAIAVNAAGTRAVVTERGLGKVAIVDLTTWMVTGEVAVGAGPVSLAITGNLAVVVNGDSNSVTVIDYVAKTVVKTIAVGMGARGVAIDATNHAYVTNQSAGTISVIDLGTNLVTSTINLGTVRPAAIQIIGGTNYAVVTDPATSNTGKVLVVNLTTSAVTTFSVNPAGNSGSGDLALFGSTAFITNPAGGTISILPLTTTPTTVTGVATTLAVGAGPRALAVDTKDNLLLVLNESTGEIVLVSLTSPQIVGRFPAVTSGGDDDSSDGDNHDDRHNAANAPAVTSILPVTGKVGTTITVTVIGTNLVSTNGLVFALPSMFPGKSEDHGKGNGLAMLAKDPAITVSGIQVNSAGTQLTATVKIAAQAALGPRVVLVTSSNGDSKFTMGSGNTFTVTP